MKRLVSSNISSASPREYKSHFTTTSQVPRFVIFSCDLASRNYGLTPRLPAADMDEPDFLLPINILQLCVRKHRDTQGYSATRVKDITMTLLYCEVLYSTVKMANRKARLPEYISHKCIIIYRSELRQRLNV